MSPWRAGYGSASKVHIRIRKESAYWVWRVVVNANDHCGDIGASGERLTWAEAFSAAREECMWWVR
jgi:hypothetical protein